MIASVRGWINYYGKFYRSELYSTLQSLNFAIAPLGGTQIKAIQRQPQTRLDVANSVVSQEPEDILSLVLWHYSLLLQIETGQDKMSRMRGDFHVRFCGRHRVKFPMPTRRLNDFSLTAHRQINKPSKNNRCAVDESAMSQQRNSDESSTPRRHCDCEETQRHFERSREICIALPSLPAKQSMSIPPSP